MVEHLSLKSCMHCQHNCISTRLVIQKSLVFSFVVLFYFHVPLIGQHSCGSCWLEP